MTDLIRQSAWLDKRSGHQLASVQPVLLIPSSLHCLIHVLPHLPASFLFSALVFSQLNNAPLITFPDWFHFCDTCYQHPCGVCDTVSLT